MFVSQLKIKTMKAQQFEELANEITGLKIKIYKPRDPNDKWTTYMPFISQLEPETIYGIMIVDQYGDNIEYRFKTTKKEETFFKSFINQHISKYEMKQAEYKMVDGQVQSVYPKRAEVVKKYTSDRVSKFHFYTTLYGIGMFAFFTKDIAKATVELAKYLKSKGVTYSNEYSDAGWVYRFCINDKVENHNQLLENFNI
jgi:hypothetical protein